MQEMNLPALIFLIASASGVVFLPRAWAPIPLLASACYMTIGQGIVLGPISLPIFRMVLAAGLIRVLIRREAIAGGLNAMDKMMIAWALWIIFAGFFHVWDKGSGPIYASGLVYNVMLVYLLTRAWCKDPEELMAILRMVAWLLVPVAAAMLMEHILRRNYFGVLFGGVSEGIYIRNGQIRAQGPFAHPILAGTVGAVCFPLMIGIWQRFRWSAAIGSIACLCMVMASTSSGPLASLIMALAALCAWYVRSYMSVVRWAALGAYASAAVLMNRPAYYLISEIDLTGSSTGWHRSHLIQEAFSHISEWWAFGTDRTAHWMPYSLDGEHADITNFYLWIGVIGGFPAMIMLIVIMWLAFTWVGTSMRAVPSTMLDRQFLIWCLGAGLFAHAGTSLSVAYFDQSMIFFWLNVGLISAMYSATVRPMDRTLVVAKGRVRKPVKRRRSRIKSRPVARQPS